MHHSSRTFIQKGLRIVAIGLVIGSVLGLGNPSTLAKSAKVPSRNLKKTAKPLPPAYYEAVKAFNGGKYKDALGQFQHLDEFGFCCDKVHYYIAQSYQGMNQTAPAALNYEWVCMYSKDPTLTYYSQMALNNLSYYRGHRTYAGQGNNISHVATARGYSGGYSGGSYASGSYASGGSYTTSTSGMVGG